MSRPDSDAVGTGPEAAVAVRAVCSGRNDQCPPTCRLLSEDGLRESCAHDGMAAASQDPELGRLREIVRRDQVCWEVYPKTLKVATGLRRVGFEIELFGTHEHPWLPMTSDCAECHSVQDDLRTIARWIVPREPRRTRCEIECYEAELNFSPRRKFRGDVRVAIDVVHRDGFDQPVDECQIRCVREIKQRLQDVGARPEKW